MTDLVTSTAGPIASRIQRECGTSPAGACARTSPSPPRPGASPTTPRSRTPLASAAPRHWPTTTIGQYTPDAARALHAETFDPEVLAKQGYRNEHLDQLVIDLILGLRCPGPILMSAIPHSPPMTGGRIARVVGGEDLFDDRHVAEGVLGGRRQRKAVAYGAGEGVPLHRVLVARRELVDGLVGGHGRVAARRQDNSRRQVGRDVERDLDLQATVGAEQVDPLIGLELGGTRECRLAAPEVEHR